MCKVSVVIPCYNRKNVIIRAINSVINQTFKDYEIIIVDDGSTDDTDAVVEDFMKANPSVDIQYIKQKNEGPSSARNKGVNHSNGEYIAFLDSDDGWEPYKLEEQMNFMEKNKDVAITGTNYNIVTNSIRQKHALEPDYIEADFYKMLFKVFFCMPTVVIKRDIFFNDNIWFKEGKNQGEDLLLFLQILRKYRGVRLSNPLVNLYKSEYGESGLTGDLVSMLNNDFDNIKILYRENANSSKKISKIKYLYLFFYTYLKHIKRVLVSKKARIIKGRDY